MQRFGCDSNVRSNYFRGSKKSSVAVNDGDLDINPFLKDPKIVRSC